MLPFFAAVLPVVILFCGLVLDVGTIQLRRVQLQSAADSAALAWELELEHNSSSTQITAAVNTDAGTNGFTNGANGVTVSMQRPANSGTYSTFYDALQVTVSQNVKTIFMGTFTGGTTLVSARAIALIPPCSYFNGALTSNQYPWYAASASWYAPCPTYVNRAIGVDGFGNFNSPYGINVTGAAGSSFIAGSIAVVPRYGAAVMADPLAAVIPPVFSGTCTYAGVSVNGGVYAVGPGTYCGGMSITNATVTLLPGLYVITGGMTITSSTLSGTGVTMFFTQGGGSTYGKVVIRSASTVNLSAPNDNANGGIPTILFFFDPNWVKTSNQDFTWNDSYFYGDGIWYGKNTGFFMWNMGIPAGPNYFGMVADNLYLFRTNVHPTMNFSNIAGGSPYRPAGGLVQ